jgi:hypothetical protein
LSTAHDAKLSGERCSDAALLRHVCATQWGTRKYMNMNLHEEIDKESVYSEA